jgi:hypothetical protein
MYDPVFTAKSLASDWELTLGALPPAMKAAVDLFEESDYAQAPPTHFDLTGVTLANVAAKIEAHAQILAVEDKHNEARRHARTALANVVVQAAADSVPDVIRTLTPEFDDAVQAYLAAVEALPERFDADQLLGNPEIEAAHRAASEAAARIKAIDSWLGHTAALPGYLTTERHSVLRVIEAKDRAQLQALLDAQTGKSTAAEQKVIPIYRVAADLGLTFRMATQSEAEELRREINAMPVVRKPLKFASLR